MLLVDDAPRDVVFGLAEAVVACDEREAADRRDVLAWVRSGAPLFRVVSPAEPPKHLAVYVALVDEARRSVMLVDHVKAGVWLLPGGHVDPGEDPRETAVRETAEELGIEARFNERFGGGEPFFLSVTQTRGAGSHTDVTFWFVVRGDEEQEVTPDPREFRGVRWFPLDASAAWPVERFDPHMGRFVQKLMAAYEVCAL